MKIHDNVPERRGACTCDWRVGSRRYLDLQLVCLDLHTYMISVITYDYGYLSCICQVHHQVSAAILKWGLVLKTSFWINLLMNIRVMFCGIGCELVIRREL